MYTKYKLKIHLPKLENSVTIVTFSMTSRKKGFVRNSAIIAILLIPTCFLRNCSKITGVFWYFLCFCLWTSPVHSFFLPEAPNY